MPATDFPYPTVRCAHRGCLATSRTPAFDGWGFWPDRPGDEDGWRCIEHHRERVLSLAPAQHAARSS
jgi:hypothetical protein